MNRQSDESLTIEEEYQIWKTNVPLLYDFVSETKLSWPSLTTQWLPIASDTPITRQELILGTYTSGEDENYLKIATIDLPIEVINPDLVDKTHDPEKHIRSNIRITKKLKHEGEVTRARFMPQDPNLIATINGTGKIFLFDRSKENDALISRFSFHTKNGYGLCFNPNTKGELISGSDDHKIALWDISSNNTVPVKIINTHSDIVNDCKWHEFDMNIFGSVSEDNLMQLHDKRLEIPTTFVKMHSPLNTLAFSKHSHNLFSAGGTDSLIYLYDIRKTSTTLHTISGHHDSVTSLEFSPHKDGILCSSGSDRRVFLWDIFQIGAEQAPEDTEDGLPELMVMHAGHRSPVNDFSYNWNIPWLMASVEEDNLIQLWKVSTKLTNPDLSQIYNADYLE